MNKPWAVRGCNVKLFYLYIYPPDLQESDGDVIHRVSNYPNLIPEMPRYCCLVNSFIKIRLKFKIAHQDH